MSKVYPNVTPREPLRGLAIRPVEGTPHMARIIHAQSGLHLPGRFLAAEVEQARDRLLALKVDWTLPTAELFQQLRKRFTFHGFDWSHFQVWHIAKHGAPHKWKTFREFKGAQRKLLLAHQASTFALAAQFIN